MNTSETTFPEHRMRTSFAAAKKWQWRESPSGEPIYWPPYHGIHESLFAFACRSAEEGYNETETDEFIRKGLSTYHTRREVSDYEIEQQIRGGFIKATDTESPVDSKYLERFDRHHAKEVYEACRATMEDLAEISPLPPPADVSEALSALYKPFELINLGLSTKQTKTRSLSEWLKRSDLIDQEFIVPHPMTARVGITNDGRPHRPRTRSNTGPRRWVIVEFDQPDPLWQPSLIMELADFCGQQPAVVLWSGNKSLHSWWEIGDATPAAVEAFENEAIRLGGDRVFFGENRRAQCARLPMAIRKENGNIQKVIFWNVDRKESK
jgi:hypothetical protein